MDLPSLRHFKNEGIFHIKSDPVQALHDGKWITAVYTDKGWASADGSTLLTGITAWRHAIKEGQKQKGHPAEHQAGDQSGDTAKASGSNRVRKSRKIPQKEG